jgi:hypothetical protein
LRKNKAAKCSAEQSISVGTLFCAAAAGYNHLYLISIEKFQVVMLTTLYSIREKVGDTLLLQ